MAAGFSVKDALNKNSRAVLRTRSTKALQSRSAVRKRLTKRTL